MPTIIIPARLESTRLHNKLLLDDTGKPLLLHTIERALESKIDNIIVATENIEIKQIVDKIQNERLHAVITPKLASGTDRVIWVVDNIKGFDFSYIINFQGDEPELPGYYVDVLLEFIKYSDVVTLSLKATQSSYNDENCVKVVLDHNDYAMYFTRSSVPFNGVNDALIHIGIYAYNLESLRRIKTMRDSTLLTERLEQLKWLQSGLKIKVLRTDLLQTGIDTQKEYDLFVVRERNRRNLN